MTTANLTVIGNVLFKRGNTTVASAYTGVPGEIIIDTTLQTIRIQDGVTAGGHLMSNAANAAVQSAAITSLQANAAIQAAILDTLTGNAATQGGALNDLVANAAAQASSLTVLIANAATQAQQIANAGGNTTQLTNGAYQLKLQANGNVTVPSGTHFIVPENANIALRATGPTGNAHVEWHNDATGDRSTVRYSATGVEVYTTSSGVQRSWLFHPDGSTHFPQFTFPLGAGAPDSYLKSDGVGGLNWYTEFGNLIPSANVTYSLGSSTRQWKDLWVSNNTIYIGGTPIRVDGGTLLVNGAPVSGGSTYGNANVSTYLSAFDGNIIPTQANVYTLGTPQFPFNHLYVGTGSITIGNVQLSDAGGTLSLTDTTYANGMSSISGFNVIAQTEPGDDSNAVILSSTVGRPAIQMARNNNQSRFWVTNDGLTIDTQLTLQGNLTVPAITAPNDTAFQLQAKDIDSLLRNEIRIDPNNGTYMSVWSGELDASFSTSDWATGSWVNDGGIGLATFTVAENLQDFWTTGVGSFVNSVEVSINGGARTPVQYDGNNGQQFGVALFTDAFPGTTTSITSLTFYYRTQSKIEIDYDGGEILLDGQALNINLQTTNGLNIQSGQTLDIKNIGQQPVRIFTDDTTHVWEFDGAGSLTLPREGRITGIGDGVAGGDRYGYISWSGNSSGDGSGFNTMRLVPDLQGLEELDQYIIIDPTSGEPGHIHIRAGGTQDNSLADLYLGGENSHVKIGAGVNPPVTLLANNHSWTFGTDGNLTLPGGGSINGADYDVDITAGNDGVSTFGHISFTANGPNGLNSLTYNSLGEITVVTAGANDGLIKWVGNSSGDGAGYTTMTMVPDTTREGTDQYIIIDPTGGEPGHIHLRAGGTQDDSSADLYLGGELTAVRVSDTSGIVTVRTTNIGDPNITMDWSFQPDGNLYFPGIGNNRIGESEPGLVVTSDNSVVLQANNSGNINEIKEWTFGTDGVITLPNGMSIESDGAPGVNAVVTIGGNDTRISIYNDGAPPGLYITANATGTAQQWVFGPAGDLAFPDGSFQTTAYTGGAGGAGNALVNGAYTVALQANGVLTLGGTATISNASEEFRLWADNDITVYRNGQDGYGVKAGNIEVYTDNGLRTVTNSDGFELKTGNITIPNDKGVVFANGVNILSTIVGITSINTSVTTSTINDESGDFSYGSLSYDYAVNGVTSGGFTIDYSAPLVHGNVDVNVGNVIVTNISAAGTIGANVIQVLSDLTSFGASPAPRIYGFSSIATTGSAVNEGNISASGNLVAGRHAYVTGNVFATNVSVSGNLTVDNTLVNRVYLLEAYANVTYTLPGSFTEDPCRYSVVSNAVNVPSAWFDTSTYTFTPQKAGYWEITAAYDVYRNGEASMAIKKNNTIVAAAGSFNAVAQQVTKIIYFNGSTDSANIINVGGAALQRDQYDSRSWFQARWVGA